MKISDMSEKDLNLWLNNFLKLLSENGNPNFIKMMEELSICEQPLYLEHTDIEDLISVTKLILDGKLDFEINADCNVLIYDGVKISTLDSFSKKGNLSYFRYRLENYPDKYIRVTTYYSSWDGPDYSSLDIDIVEKFKTTGFNYRKI